MQLDHDHVNIHGSLVLSIIGNGVQLSVLFTFYATTAKVVTNNKNYYKTELVFWSVRKSAHGDSFLNGPRFYEVVPVQYDFYSGLVSFSRKIFGDILIKFEN